MKKRWLIVTLVTVAMLCLMCSCSESSRVSANISQQADNFNITRRFVAINTRTDAPLLEVIGNFAIQNSSHDELEVIVEIAPGQYKKHYVYLNEWVTYTVEDVSGAFVDKYHYEVNFLPEMIIPLTITNYD